MKSYNPHMFWMRFIAVTLATIACALWLICGEMLFGAEFTVVANHSPAGKYCAFPGASRMTDGRIICVFYAGLGHVTNTNQRKGGGAIAYTISEDDGDNWSEPEILLDTPMDDRDPSISLLRDGRLMLTYFRLYTFPPPLRGDGVYIAEIVAGGVGETGQRTSYSKSRLTVRPASIRKLQHDAGCSSPIRDFGDGLLMLGSYHVEQPYVIRSGDNGYIWQVFAIPNGGKHLDAETDVIELKTGANVPIHAEPLNASRSNGTTSRRSERVLPPARFYAVMRGSNCNGHYSTSSDGKNWTVAKDIGFVLHCPELHRVELGGGDITPDGGKPAMGISPNHKKRKVDRDMQSPNSAILLAHRVPAKAMHYSLDECKTWKGPIKVDSCGGAYPCFVTCKDGSVLIVYYTEGTNSDIRCRRFTITKEGISWR